MIHSSSCKKVLNSFLIIIILAFIVSCAAPRQQQLQTEKDFQQAFNRVYFHGKAEMEVPVKYGRIDLLTSDYAIEVDKLEHFHEAIGQALHYAKETGRKPGVAIYILHHKEGDEEKLKYVTWLCKYYGIKVWFINDELKKAQK